MQPEARIILRRSPTRPSETSMPPLACVSRAVAQRESRLGVEVAVEQIGRDVGSSVRAPKRPARPHEPQLQPERRVPDRAR